MASYMMLIGALLAGTILASPLRAQEAEASDAFSVIAEARRLGAADLWPGFAFGAVPVAIYDGERTLLFGHPVQPEGFQAVAGRADVTSYPGRHPSIAANSSVELDGVWTATLMPSSAGASLRRRAGLVIHEVFHVFQRERHPSWSANEVELFTYPSGDAELLTLRRLETEALRRALAVGSPGDAGCWAVVALRMRSERFAALPPGSVDYERKTELNEGLATYVEYRATGVADTAVLPARDFSPDAVRQRAYRSGTAIARLLDRFAPDWRTELARNDSVPLDVLLGRALIGRRDLETACAFLAGERDRIRAGAVASVEVLRAGRADRRRAFLDEPGWRLVILAPGGPLFPQGFDPLNVHHVGDGEVLHTRFLKLGNDSGAVEVLGRGALTAASGPHPLFNGVRRLTITGLPEPPSVSEGRETIRVQADGVEAELSGAVVERSGATITVRLVPR